jgi:DNA-binding winged helix-turn-helix (wHTH) protein
VKLRLGETTFDADTRQLLRAGAEVHLSPKAFDLLNVLDHRPRALSKQELHEHLWADDVRIGRQPAESHRGASQSSP